MESKELMWQLVQTARMINMKKTLDKMLNRPSGVCCVEDGIR
jgi:hypothetical protein